MDLALSEEQVLLREMVRRFLADRQGAAIIGREPMTGDNWRTLGKLGLFAFLLPESVGGMDGGAPDAMIVAEEFGRGLAITPLVESVLLCAGLLAAHGTPAQVERWLLPVMQGETVLAFAQGVKASHGGNGWIVDGTPVLVRDGMQAAALLIAATSGELLLVDAQAAGLARTPVRLADGSIAAQIRFDNVAADLVLASAKDIAAFISRADLAIVAELVGAMSMLYDATVDYVKQRQQFGVPIGSFQTVQHRVARLFVLLEQSRSMLLRAALCDEGERALAVLSAKAYVSDAALRLAEDAVQLHGGMGITDELPVGRGLRRVLVLSKLFGGGVAARRALTS